MFENVKAQQIHIPSALNQPKKLTVREASKEKKNGKKKGTLSTRGGGQPQFPFFAQIYRNLWGPQITQKLSQTPWKYNFFVTFCCHFYAF